MMWLSDERAAVCWTDKDGQLRCGTWHMRRKALDELRPPTELQKGKRRCLGFLSNPPRIAFCDMDQDKRPKPPVYLLDIATGGVTPIEAPTGFTCGWLFKGTSRLLLTPEPPDSDRPSCLLDLATGEATGVEKLVPQPPGGRWAATCVEPTPAGRWLLVCAREAGEALSVWYAVDIGSLEVFCHAPPKPFPVYYQEVDSGIVAQWADGGHRPHLIYYPLRDTDPAKRLVIAWAGQDAATSHSICWLNDHQFVFAAWPYVKDEAVQRAWMRPVVRTCLLLGDVATRQISPLWPSKGLAGECRFVPWPEWEGKKQ